MSRASTYLATSSVAGHTPITVGGRALLRDHAGFRAALRGRAPDLERFIAEPLFSGTAGEGLGNVSWYSSFEQASSTLSELSERHREQVLRTLAERLEQALALIDDPEVGESVRAMLIVPSRESVRVVGAEPVLIDWGVAPIGVGSTSDALQAHFDRVFQPLCGVSWPRHGTDSDEMPHGAMAVAAAGETDGSGSLDDAEMAANSLTPIPTAHDSSLVAHAQTDEGGNRPGVGGAAAVAVPFPVPWYRRRAIGVYLALLLTGLILFILWWLLLAPGGLLSRGLPGGYPHESIVDSLRDERDRLRDLNEMACGPELIESVRDGFSGPLVVPPLAGGVDREGASDGASGPEAVPGQVTPSDDSPPGTQGVVSGSSLTALAQRLERSVVLVVGAAGAGGVGMGTGFFIGPDLLVTNRHVVENVDPARVIVTSEFLGVVRAVRVVSMTSDSEIGRPDFAVLQLQGGPVEGVVPLSIRESAPKLARVVTAGFPAYIARSDPQLTALLGGDAQAAPSMVFTSGEVSVVQGQRTGTEIIIHTADMSQGSSGGPLVDACGRVAGVNTFIGTDDASGRRGLYSLAGSGLMSFLSSKGVVFGRADGLCADGGEVAASGE